MTKPKLYINLSITLLSTLAALALAESFMRLFLPAPTVIHLNTYGRESAFELSENPILGYTMKRNYFADSPDCHNTFASTNSLGFRDSERELVAKPDIKRVIVLGDSVIAGHGICNTANTIPAQIEQLLIPEGIEVLNFGVGGYCTRGEVELLLDRGLSLKPNLVIVLFVENDYVNSNGAIIESIANPVPPLLRTALSHSHLVRRILLSTNMLGLGDSLDAPSRLKANQAAMGDNNVIEGFTLLKELAAEHNFEILVAFWPQFGDRAILEPHAPHQSPHDPLSQAEIWANELGLTSFRLSAYFVDHFEQLKRERAIKAGSGSASNARLTPRWSYTTGDGVHPNELGAEVAAKALADWIRTNGLVYE